MLGKILKGLGVFIIIFIALVIISFFFAQKASPPTLVANFINLDKIEKISKYRSCAGHVTVPQDERETKRNMKHYYWVKPEYYGTDTVEIYAPFDGFVTVLREEPELNLEGEIGIVPKDAFVWLPPIYRWSFSVQHIYVRDDLRQGSEVKSGELIGYAASDADKRLGGSFDIVYAKFGLPFKTIDNWRAPFVDLDSVFNHMSDKVLAEYMAKGVTSKDDFIISKETRDQNLCRYQGEGPYFMNQEAEENWVVFQ